MFGYRWNRGALRHGGRFFRSVASDALAVSAALILTAHHVVVEFRVEDHPPTRDSLNASALMVGIAAFGIGGLQTRNRFLGVG